MKRISQNSVRSHSDCEDVRDSVLPGNSIDDGLKAASCAGTHLVVGAEIEVCAKLSANGWRELVEVVPDFSRHVHRAIECRGCVSPPLNKYFSHVERAGESQSKCKEFRCDPIRWAPT